MWVRHTRTCVCVHMYVWCVYVHVYVYVCVYDEYTLKMKDNPEMVLRT